MYNYIYVILTSIFIIQCVNALNPFPQNQINNHSNSIYNKLKNETNKMTKSRSHPTQSVERFLFLVPNAMTKWTRGHVEELSCPPLVNIPSKTNLKEINIQIREPIRHHELDPVKGFLCSGLKYKVSCSENFFGQKSIKKYINYFHPSKEECFNNLNKYISQELLDPYFPGEDCNWMRDTDSEKTFVTYLPHDVKYDPYKNGYYDPLFLKDYCYEEDCETEHDQTRWITLNKLVDECQFSKTRTYKLVYNSDYSIMKIEYEINRWENVDEGCLITYCNRKGVRLSNGLFFSGSFYQDLDLDVCPKDTKISIKPIESQIDDLQDELIMDQERLYCLDSVRQMVATKKLSFYSLSFLEPKYRLLHNAYRINNNQLEMSKVEWEPLESFDFSEPDLLGKNTRGSNVYWKEWVPSGIPNLLSGFNGVYKNNLTNKVFVSRIEAIKSDYNREIMLEHNLKEIEHPNIIHVQREKINNSIVDISNKDHSDFGGWISSVFQTLWGKIITFIISGILLIIFILFLIYCCPCICRNLFKLKTKKQKTKKRSRKRYTSESDEISDIEMGIRSNNKTREDKKTKTVNTNTPRNFNNKLLKPIPVEEREQETDFMQSSKYFFK